MPWVGVPGSRPESNLVRDAVLGVLTVAVLGRVGTSLVVGARRAGRRRSPTTDVLRGVRLRHVWPAPVVLTAVVVFGPAWLVPPLRFGWWSLLGGQGYAVLGTTDQTIGRAWEVIVPVVFALLLTALPLLVDAEERRFRRGAEGRTTARRALRGLQFGLVAASLALSACGLADSSELRVESPDLRDGRSLDERFTCTGENAVPTLRWSGGGDGVGGWAVVVEDADSPMGTFTHWIVTGLGPATRSVGAQLPEGAVAGLTSSGRPGYVGPCPTTGEEHRFRFRVHALSEPLVLEADTPVVVARRRIETLSLDAAELEVTHRTP